MMAFNNRDSSVNMLIVFLFILALFAMIPIANHISHERMVGAIRERRLIPSEEDFKTLTIKEMESLPEDIVHDFSPSLHVIRVTFSDGTSRDIDVEGPYEATISAIRIIDKGAERDAK